MVHGLHVRVVALAALLCVALSAASAEYLIAPLISDRLTIVQAGSTTGSNLDRNDYHVAALPQLPFDEGIEKAVVAAVTKVDPAATFKSLAFRAGLPGADLERDDPKDTTQKLVKLLAPQVRAGEKQWVVAIVPVRGEPRMRLRNGHVGHGRVAGVGFYVDRVMPIQRLATGETDLGFLGAFANFTVLMIDPSSGAIASRQTVQEGVLRSVAGTGKTHPWDVISAEDKVKMINGLVAREVRRVMPDVLAGAGFR